MFNQNKKLREGMKQFEELITTSEFERELLTRCRDAIRSVDSSTEVILYGSRARGDAGSESDYDLLILTDHDAIIEREDSICSRLYPIELETGAVITAFVYNRLQWATPLCRAMPFHKNVERDGVIL